MSIICEHPKPARSHLILTLRYRKLINGTGKLGAVQPFVINAFQMRVVSRKGYILNCGGCGILNQKVLRRSTVVGESKTNESSGGPTTPCVACAATLPYSVQILGQW